MPAANNERFRVGDYWLSKQARSDYWCRTWYDDATRQTKRSSLRETNFERAKEVLTDWFIKNRTINKALPESVTLAEIFAPFYEKHASKLASSYQAQLALRYWLDFFADATVEDATQVSEQERFQNWLIIEKGLNPNTASRTVSVGKTALNWAWKRGQLANVPYILPVKKTASQPKGRPLEVAEIKALLEHAKSQHLRDFIWLMLATTARPDAILDLTLDRCDLGERIIRLNPTVRTQTKKYRPTVKMPEAIVPLITRRRMTDDCPYLIAYNAKKVSSVKTGWRNARRAAGLDMAVNPYSLRHTMARWLRSQSVPVWEVQAQLGHKQAGAGTTEIYAPFDPAYLANSVMAIDKFLHEIE